METFSIGIQPHKFTKKILEVNQFQNASELDTNLKLTPF